MKLTTNTEPLLIVRLGAKWTSEPEEIEPGYFRSGRGWYADISDSELEDSVRAWWKLDVNTLERLNVEHVVAYAGGCTRALYFIEIVLSPRAHDGKLAFCLRQVESGNLFEKVIGNEGFAIDFPKGSANPIRYWPPNIRSRSKRSSRS